MNIFSRTFNMNNNVGFGVKEYGNGFYFIPMVDVDGLDVTREAEDLHSLYEFVGNVETRGRMGNGNFSEAKEETLKQFPMIQESMIYEDYSVDVEECLESLRTLGRGELQEYKPNPVIDSVVGCSVISDTVIINKLQEIIQMYRSAEYLEEDIGSSFDNYVSSVYSKVFAYYIYALTIIYNKKNFGSMEHRRILNYVGTLPLECKATNAYGLRKLYNDHTRTLYQQVVSKAVATARTFEGELGVLDVSDSTNLYAVVNDLRNEGINVDFVDSLSWKVQCGQDGSIDYDRKFVEWLYGIKRNDIEDSVSFSEYVGKRIPADVIRRIKEKADSATSKLGINSSYLHMTQFQLPDLKIYR